MDHKKVVRQSWQLLWGYRLLWIFGFALALTTCTWQGASNLGERYDSGQRITVRLDDGIMYIPGPRATINMTRADRFQIFIPIVVAPVLFLNGLLHVYGSSLWTLTYRQLRALESEEPIPAAKAALGGAY